MGGSVDTPSSSRNSLLEKVKSASKTKRDSEPPADSKYSLDPFSDVLGES
jgi:hypothetical protein